MYSSGYSVLFAYFTISFVDLKASCSETMPLWSDSVSRQAVSCREAMTLLSDSASRRAVSCSEAMTLWSDSASRTAALSNFAKFGSSISSFCWLLGVLVVFFCSFLSWHIYSPCHFRQCFDELLQVKCWATDLNFTWFQLTVMSNSCLLWWCFSQKTV